MTATTPRFYLKSYRAQGAAQDARSTRSFKTIEGLFAFVKKLVPEGAHIIYTHGKNGAEYPCDVAAVVTLDRTKGSLCKHAGCRAAAVYFTPTGLFCTGHGQERGYGLEDKPQAEPDTLVYNPSDPYRLLSVITYEGHRLNLRRSFTSLQALVSFASVLCGEGGVYCYCDWEDKDDRNPTTVDVTAVDLKSDYIRR